MAQIQKKFIGDNQVADEKIRLDNASYLRARNAANSGDVNVIGVNASDEVIVQNALLPATDNSISLGSASKAFINLLLKKIKVWSSVSTYWTGTTQAVLVENDASPSVEFLVGSTDAANASEATKYVTLISGAQQDTGSSVATGRVTLWTGDHYGTGATGDLIMYTGWNYDNSGATGGFSLGSGNSSNGTGATGVGTIETGAINAAGSSANTGSITIRSGNNAGSGNSGSLTLQTGTVTTGSRGKFFLKEASLGAASVGHVLTLQNTSTGEVAFQAPASSGAVAAKEAVRVVARSSITLSGTQTIDNVAVVAGDRVLVMGQGTASDNGIYIVSAGAWSRASDANASADFVNGFVVYVAEGQNNADSLYAFNFYSLTPFVLNTDAVYFTKQTLKHEEENFTLNGTDITNQYVDLQHEVYNAGATIAMYVRGLGLTETAYDYTLSTVSGVTRVTFANDLATGGASPLVAGDRLQIKYQY